MTEMRRRRSGGSPKRVAVLGAGLAGVLTALELAEAGCDVHLFDRCPVPLARASFASEGKIHLGYVYALDRGLETARTMIKGAASFHPLLERWLPAGLLQQHASAPFVYAVPADSMMTCDQIRKHFADVSDMLARAGPAFAPDRAQVREMSRQDFVSLFDPAFVQTAFHTQEFALDSTVICKALRSVVGDAEGILQRMSSEVTSVEDDKRGIRVTATGPEGSFTGCYAAVVNALWEQRLLIDGQVGLETSRPAVHRYKAGLRTRDPHVCATLPTVTFLIGPYGDTVGCRESAYVSWYPAGLLSQEVGLRPSRFEIVLSGAERAGLVTETLSNLRRLMPGAASSLAETGPDWDVVGGYITAWGRTGISDRRSELHRRHEVGVHSRGSFHSIDTGKLTLAPLFANEASARVLAA